MTRLATNYRATNTDQCCPLCKRGEDNYDHMTKCSEYELDKDLNVSLKILSVQKGSFQETAFPKERRDMS